MTSQPLALYFIAHSIDANADMDLLVCAGDVSGALLHWRSYFALEDEAQPREVFQVTDPRPRAGPIAWHRDDGLKCVSEHD